jgi:hypothetical protein
MACPGGSATCTATLTGGWAAGDAVWWIQTWNSDGYGPWSAGMRFAVNYVPGAWGQSLSPTDRFQLVMGGVAVLDRETGLVWERTPGAGGATTWDLAVAECPRRPVGGRLGWRLPTYEEQASLVDPAQTDPALPPGHPFSNANAFFWSASTSPTDPTYVLGMNFRFGSPNSGLKTSAFPYWCVRGGQTAQSPQ